MSGSDGGRATDAPARVLPSLPPSVLQLVLCRTGTVESSRISKSTSCSAWTPECMALWLTERYMQPLLYYRRVSITSPHINSHPSDSAAQAADDSSPAGSSGSLSADDDHFTEAVQFAARVHTCRHTVEVRQYIACSFPHMPIMVESRLQADSHAAQQQLNHAARTGDYLTCHYLLRHRFAYADANDSAALILAADHGHVHVLQLLLQQPDRPANAAAQGSTALSLAALKGHMQTCKLLLLHGAQANSWSCLALQWAAVCGDVEVVRLLLGAAENPARADARGGQPLIEAAKHGHADVVQLLLQHEPHGNIRESQALVVAAEGGHAQVCALLLQQQLKPARADAQGGKALVMAAQQGDLEICQMLLHANPQPPEQAQRAALTSARELGHTSIEYLLAAHLQSCKRSLSCQVPSTSGSWYETEYLPLWVFS